MVRGIAQPPSAGVVGDQATPAGRTPRFPATLPVGWLGIGALHVVAGVLPAVVVLLVQEEHALAFQLDYFVLMLQLNVIGLLFPLLAALPFVFPFSAQTSRRFLTYAAVRGDIRRLVLACYGRCLVVTGLAFAPLLPALYLVSLATRPTFHPNLYAGGRPYTPETFSTFSQVAGYGDWAYVAVITGWLTVHAVVYAWLTLSTVLLVPQRALGLSLPWIAFFAVTFAMAVAGAEAFSPATVTPFNLTQLPWWQPLPQLGVLVVLAVGLMAWTVRTAPRRCQ